ncbi:hypothetical protein GCM10010304_05240 [Streptomyces roseoviolaceus]
MKISAGSSGMRRRHLLMPEGVVGPTGGDAGLRGAVSVVVMCLPPPEGSTSQALRALGETGQGSRYPADQGTGRALWGYFR